MENLKKTLYDANVGKFYDEWESKTSDERESIISRKLDEHIEFTMKNVPFYRDRLSSYGKNGKYPLSSIPVLNSSKLRELLPPQSTDIVVGNQKDYSVFQSGGTTGFPKTTIFSHEELEGLNLPNARGFFALGLNKDDRVANMFAVGGLYMTFIHINRMLQQYGCMNFPFSNHSQIGFVKTMVEKFDINCITGITSVVLNALRGMAKAEPGRIRFDKVFYGGEHIYEADKKEIKKTFGAKIIAAPGYGTIDSWYIGYQCAHCDTGVFHAHDDQCYIEIVNEETGAHCEAGEEGLIYVTPFTRRLTPIIRYRVGDRAIWLKEKCSCGRTTPVFKLLGRSDDTLRIGFDSIDYDYMQKAVGKIGRLSSSVQMEKIRESGRDRLIIRVETDAPEVEYSQIAKNLEDEIMKNRDTLRESVLNGAVLPVKIEILKHGDIARNPRTGKLTRTIDSLKSV